MARFRLPGIRKATGCFSRLFIVVSGLLPLAVCRVLGHVLGTIGYYLVPRLRCVARQNIDRVYGDTLSPAEKRRIALGAIRNITTVATEFARLRHFNKDFVEKHIITEDSGINMPEKGGVLLIGAHLGNWEWMPLTTKILFPNPVSVVVRPLDDPALNRTVDRLRTANGVRTIPKEGAGAEIIRRLRHGEIVGVLIDQSPRESAVPVSFMGHPTWATVAPVMAAFRAHVPVIPFAYVRQATGEYVMRFYPPVEMVRTGNLHQDIQDSTQRCQDVIADIIRTYPDQWLWMHRRWKTRPRLEKEWTRRQALRSESEPRIDTDRH